MIDVSERAFSSYVLDITSLIPNGKYPIAFVMTGGLTSHYATIWRNLDNHTWNVTFRLWSSLEVVSSGTIGGKVICVDDH